jgi:hypothetical protein
MTAAGFGKTAIARYCAHIALAALLLLAGCRSGGRASVSIDPERGRLVTADPPAGQRAAPSASADEPHAASIAGD